MNTRKNFNAALALMILVVFLPIAPIVLAQSQECVVLKQEIKDKFGITIYDDEKLDNAQLNVIKSVLDAIDKSLYDLKLITVSEFLNGDVPEPEEQARINILGVKVGVAAEEGIPNGAHQLTDLFSIVVVHELNHAINYKRWLADEKFRHREAQLISQAGDESFNYLRSNVAVWPCGGAPTYFVGCPQEFFASISNAYFQDSAATFELALRRYKQGYKEPLNQFLYFAGVYATNMPASAIPMFRLDERGVLAVTSAPITRTAAGDINSLRVGGVFYQFVVDSDGNAQLPDPGPLGALLGRISVKGKEINVPESGNEKFILNANAGKRCRNDLLAYGFSVRYYGAGGEGSVEPNRCNPQPYFSIDLPVGDYKVWLETPPGWQVLGQNLRLVAIRNGQFAHNWFEASFQLVSVVLPGPRR